MPAFFRASFVVKLESIGEGVRRRGGKKDRVIQGQGVRDARGRGGSS